MENKFNSAAAVVREVLATTDKGVIFSGYDLRNNCAKLYARCSNMYVDTLLREMRGACSEDYELISRSESLYRKITPSRRQRKIEENKKYMTLRQPELFSEGV